MIAVRGALYRSPMMRTTIVATASIPACTAIPPLLPDISASDFFPIFSSNSN